MQSYPIPMVPGPVQVPARILSAYQHDYGSPDLEPEYMELYNQTALKMRQLLGTQNQIVFQTGEGMLSLWSALKSTIRPGDRVLTLATGVFGYGIGDMARSIGAQVKTLGFAHNETLQDWVKIEKAIIEFQPKMITVVHCETPSGTLNPLEKLGELKHKHNIPLLYADMVASVGGVPIETDTWHVDLALGGSQKVLSAPCDISFLAVSPQAGEMIEEVAYVGYDALLPFRDAQQKGEFPYTPHWHGMAAIATSLDMLLEEGLELAFKRHEMVATYCREQLQAIGYELFITPPSIPSPTVTAVKVPKGITWQAFDKKLRAEGLVVGGSYGPLAGKVFRLGHMGPQANMTIMHQALEVLEKVLKDS
ncbi:MAG: aminotransferase [Chloroflexi bacterium HGW-Chloroflexi-3]|nr:MAG: aminotransferase [Chloroflexi bacterium HGW-Chloroflexi-3]